MATVDNFNQIKNHINCEEGEFYLLQIIQRGKDQQDSEDKRSRRTIKSYYISSPEYLERKKEEIMFFCEHFNARAYINLNKKSYRQIALKGLEELAKMVAHDNFKGITSLVDSACGQTGACDKNKTWIIDVDEHDDAELEHIMTLIDDCCEPLDINNKVVDVIPTLNGSHIITKPFNKKRFNELYKKHIDIHDNNPTLLYYRR